MSETRGPWFHEKVVCLACDHQWVAVYSDPPDFFECPECGEMEGVSEDDESDYD